LLVLWWYCSNIGRSRTKMITVKDNNLGGNLD